MHGFFNIDSKFMTFMNRLADLMLLNVIYIICSIPVITIGASTTALYYVTLKMVKNEESYIFRSFLKSFKLNFKQATAIWVFILAAGILLFIDIKIVLRMDGIIGKVLFSCLGVVVFILLFINAYVFPLLSRFENTIRQTIKNALFMSIRHLPLTFLILFITAVPMGVGLYFFETIPFWILIGFALLAFGASYPLVKIFAKYEPAEDEENGDLENAEETDGIEK